MDSAADVIRWLLQQMRFVALEAWRFLDAVLTNPLVKVIAGALALFVIAYVLALLPLVRLRKLAYGLRSTPDLAGKLAKVCLARGRRHLKHGRLASALEDLDLAIRALTDVKKHSDVTRALYIESLDARAQAHELSDHWKEASDDLQQLADDQSTKTQGSRAVWLRRLAAAEHHLGMHARAQQHLQEAGLHEKSVPANASSILRMWPLIEHLVISPARDSAQLQTALADVKALVQIDPSGNAAYAEALLELTAGHATAISSLTKAAALLPPDFVDVYYWRARARATAGDLPGCLEDCARASSSTPLRGSVQYLEGYAKFGLGQLKEAVKSFAQALETEPSPDAYQGLILTKARLREWEETIANSDRALQLGISDPLIYAARGEAAMNLGRFEQALKDCSHALELSLNSIYPYRVRGVTYLLQQHWAEAILDLTAALTLDKEDAISYAYRAEAHRMQGKIAKAIEDADRAVSCSGDLVFARLVRVLVTLKRWEVEPQQALLDSAERDGAWIVALEPANASGHWAQAMVENRRGRIDEALRLATQALKCDPRFAPAYQTRGWLHLSRSAWSKAADDFRSAIALGGPADRGESYFGLAECQRMEGETRLSIETYDKAIALAPDYAPAYYGRGLGYVAVGNWAKALENYTAAITRGLRVPELYRARAWMHFYCGLDEDTMRDFADASELETSPISTFLDWGAALVVAGRPAEGAQKFSDVLERDPKSDEGYASRGWARGVEGDLEGALADVSRAIELNPRVATHFNNRAWVLCKLERWSDATSDCDRAIALDKSLDYAFKNRSLARWCLGRPDDTLGDLTEIVRLRQSSGTAPAMARDDLFNWEDQARDWAKALAQRERDAVGYLGSGIALWMSGQTAPAKEQIRRALGMTPQLQIGLDVLATIERFSSASPRSPE